MTLHDTYSEESRSRARVVIGGLRKRASFASLRHWAQGVTGRQVRVLPSSRTHLSSVPHPHPRLAAGVLTALRAVDDGCGSKGALGGREDHKKGASLRAYSNFSAFTLPKLNAATQPTRGN